MNDKSIVNENFLLLIKLSTVDALLQGENLARVREKNCCHEHFRFSWGLRNPFLQKHPQCSTILQRANFSSYGADLFCILGLDQNWNSNGRGLHGWAENLILLQTSQG